MSVDDEVFVSTFPDSELPARRLLIQAAQEWMHAYEGSPEAANRFQQVAWTSFYGSVMSYGEFGSGGPRWMDRMPASGHFVYRLVGRKPGVDPEEDVQSLYVGVTSNLRARLRAHSRKWWWVAVVEGLCEFDQRPTRKDAEALEKEMIRWYQPAMNRAGRLLIVESV